MPTKYTLKRLGWILRLASSASILGPNVVILALSRGKVEMETGASDSAGSITLRSKHLICPACWSVVAEQAFVSREHAGIE